MPPAVAPFPWFGGKDRLSKRIADLLPPHLAYIEVFGGSGAVLFAKRPSKLEVYNDVDGGVVAFFRVLRERPEELVEKLSLTPYSREEYLACRNSWDEASDDLERARRWFTTTWQMFGGGGKAHSKVGWAFDAGGRKNGSRPRTFAWRVDRLCEFAERLRHVQIEQDDWRAIFDRYDVAETSVFYLDPPYLPETRSSGVYAHELTPADHQELLERVRGLRGSVLISGYGSTLYEALEEDGFEAFTFDVHLAAAKAINEPRQRRTEVVWRRAPSDDRLFVRAGAA